MLKMKIEKDSILAAFCKIGVNSKQCWQFQSICCITFGKGFAAFIVWMSFKALWKIAQWCFHLKNFAMCLHQNNNLKLML